MTSCNLKNLQKTPHIVMYEHTIDINVTIIRLYDKRYLSSVQTRNVRQAYIMCTPCKTKVGMVSAWNKPVYTPGAYSMTKRCLCE